MSAERVIVFVKAPRPGQVKTRLAAALGTEGAAAAYRVLVTATLARLRDFSEVELRYTPDDALAEIAGWLAPGWRTRPQGAGDLGERMHRAFLEAFEQRVQRVVLIGSDCPELEAADLRAAFAALTAHDAVLGPAHDGGYWLVALNTPRPELFRSLAWGSDTVFAQTLERAAALGLRVATLRRLHDVDTPTDWDRFRSRRT